MATPSQRNGSYRPGKPLFDRRSPYGWRGASIKRLKPYEPINLVMRRKPVTIMNVESIDHIVLTVKDIEATCAFYTKVLGMKVTTFGVGRKALLFGVQKINLHEHGNEFEPKAKVPTPGSANLCFVTTVPIGQVLDHLRTNDSKEPCAKSAGRLKLKYFLYRQFSPVSRTQGVLGVH